MTTLESFLNPKRKANLKFALSTAFIGEDNKPIEWEMRQLLSSESMELGRQMGDGGYMELLTACVANALVVPNLKDKALLDGLSEREGKPILKASDALKALTTDAELADLISRYNKHNDLTKKFTDKVKEAKN